MGTTMTMRPIHSYFAAALLLGLLGSAVGALAIGAALANSGLAALTA
jgi:hypothetical protein